jgi:hypothetical protein
MTQEVIEPSTFATMHQGLNHLTTLTSYYENIDIQIDINIKLILNMYFKSSSVIFKNLLFGL